MRYGISFAGRSEESFKDIYGVAYRLFENDVRSITEDDDRFCFRCRESSGLHSLVWIYRQDSMGNPMEISLDEVGFTNIALASFTVNQSLQKDADFVESLGIKDEEPVFSDQE
jgi:hypothetical protein